MQILIVSLCIAIAVAFMGRRFYRVLRRGSRCCGQEGQSHKCDGCPATSSCQSAQKELQELKPKA